MFPISIEGKIEVQANLDDPKIVNSLFESIREKLNGEKIADIYRQDERMTFRVGNASWLTSKLSAIHSGEFSVTGGNPGTVNYKVSVFKPVLWLVVLAILILFDVFETSLTSAIESTVVWYAIFICLNYFQARNQVDAIVKKAVSIG